jgi:hypothetical protein
VNPHLRASESKFISPNCVLGINQRIFKNRKRKKKRSNQQLNSRESGSQKEAQFVDLGELGKKDPVKYSLNDFDP